MRNSIKLALTLISFTCLSGVSLANNHIKYEQCFINKVKDNKTGYSHILKKDALYEAQKAILTNKYTQIEFQKYGLPIKMTSDIEYVETFDSKPVSIKAILESLDEKTVYKAKFLSDNKIELEAKTDDTSSLSVLDYEGEILLPSAIEKLFKGNTNNKVEYQTIDLSAEFRIVKITATKEDSEIVFVDNKQVECDKYKVVADVLPNVGNYQWFDKEGHLVKEYSSVLNIEQLATSKDNVIKQNTVKNVYYENLIPIDTKIDTPENIKQITYKISSENTDLKNVFIGNSNQEIIQALGNTVYMKIKNQYNVESKADDIEAKEFLGSDYFLTIDRLEVQEVVSKFNNSNYLKLAKELESWVYENIKAENYKTNIQPAYRTLLALKGSPSEKNIVLVTLLRKMGVPSRPVVGLKYVQSPQNAFAYSMWVETFIEGKWVRLDASNPRLATAPIYIGLYNVKFDSKRDKNRLVLDVIKNFSNYKINILDIKSDLSKELSAIKDVKASSTQEFNLLNILRSGDKYITEFKHKEINEKKNNELKKQDCFNQGLLLISSDKLSQGFKLLEKAAKMHSYGDDFNNMNYALQMASLGLFSLSQEYLNQIYDTEIWQKQIDTMKSIYFPKSHEKENEELYLKAFASLRFDNEFNIEEVFANKSFKKDEMAQFILGLNYFKNKDYKKASKYFKKASKINRTNLTYKLKLADSLIKANKPRSALGVIREAENKNAVDLMFNNEVNKIKYLALSKSKKSIEDKRYYLAKYYQVAGDDKKAQELLFKSLEENVHHSATYSFLAKMSFNSDRIEEAKNFVHKALILDDKNIEALNLKAQILYEDGQTQEALKQYRKVLNINSSNKEALYKMAVIQKEERRDYNAIETLEHIKAHSACDDVYYNLAELYLSVGDEENAIANFKKTLSINPLNEVAWFRLSDIYLKNKNTFIAKKYLKPLEKLNPNYKYYYYLGLIEKLNENYDKAQEYFEKSIKLNEQSQARNEI